MSDTEKSASHSVNWVSGTSLQKEVFRKLGIFGLARHRVHCWKGLFPFWPAVHKRSAKIRYCRDTYNNNCDESWMSIQILAMVLLVVPGQQIVRGIISGISGNGFNFSVFDASDTVTAVVSVILILISLLLFRAEKSTMTQKIKRVYEHIIQSKYTLWISKILDYKAKSRRKTCDFSSILYTKNGQLLVDRFGGMVFQKRYFLLLI